MEAGADMPNYVVTSIAISVGSSLIIGFGGAAITMFVSKHLTEYRLKGLEDWKTQHTAEFSQLRDSLTTLVADVKWIKNKLDGEKE